MWIGQDPKRVGLFDTYRPNIDTPYQRIKYILNMYKYAYNILNIHIGIKFI
jgi:hypothetical protein